MAGWADVCCSLQFPLLQVFSWNVVNSALIPRSTFIFSDISTHESERLATCQRLTYNAKPLPVVDKKCRCNRWALFPTSVEIPPRLQKDTIKLKTASKLGSVISDEAFDTVKDHDDRGYWGYPLCFNFFRCCTDTWWHTSTAPVTSVATVVGPFFKYWLLSSSESKNKSSSTEEVASSSSSVKSKRSSMSLPLHGARRQCSNMSGVSEAHCRRGGN